MNRCTRLENLICLTLTYVQILLGGQWAWASPNNDPFSHPPHPELEEANNPKLETLESVSIQNPMEAPKDRLPPLFAFNGKNEIGLLVGSYYGPYLQNQGQLIHTYGFSYQWVLSPSDKFHLGFNLGLLGDSDPFIFIVKEQSLRNFWKYLRAWNYRMQIELNTEQALGSFVSLSHYSGGFGLSFELLDHLELDTNWYPLATRGMSGEVKIRLILSGF